MATKQIFIERYAQAAQAACVGTGYFASVMLAQAALETGWGKSQLSELHNNFFGIKAGSSWTGKTVTMRTKEQNKNGSVYYENAVFRKYDTPEDSFRDRINFLNSKKRYELVRKANTPKQQIQAIKDAGYATDVSYVSKIMLIIDANNFVSWDKIIQTATAAATTATATVKNNPLKSAAFGLLASICIYKLMD
jgi:N-acetylmuramoyl-L-alanine amidase